MLPTHFINPGNLVAAPMNPSVAMMPGQAVSQIGGAMVKVGEDMNRMREVDDRLARIEDAGTASAFMANADAETRKFETELLTRHDTQSYPEEYRTLAQDLRTRAAELPFRTAEGKARFKAHLDPWITLRQSEIDTTAKTKGLAIAHGRSVNTLDYARKLGDKPLFDYTLTEGIKSGLISPQDAQKYQQEFALEVAANDRQTEIIADPEAWMKKHPEGSVVPGLDANGSHKAYRFAMAQLGAKGDAFAMQMEDRIAQGIEDKEIRETGKTQNQRPAVVEALVATNQRRAKADYETNMAKPEVIAANVGRAKAMMLSYDATDAATFDAKRAEILGVIGDLPKGHPMRDELENNLAALKSNKQVEIKTHAQAAQKALDEHFKTTVLDKLWDGDSGLPVATAIDEGFLKGEDDLRKLGLSKDQAKDIKDAKTEADQIRLFREYWQKRENPNARPGPWLEAVANAIFMNKTDVLFKTPENAAKASAARTAAELQHGRNQVEMMEFLRMTPPPTAEQISEKVKGITGQNLRLEARRKNLAPRPTSARRPLPAANALELPSWTDVPAAPMDGGVLPPKP